MTAEIPERVLARVYDQRDRHVADVYHESLLHEMQECPMYQVYPLDQQEQTRPTAVTEVSP